MSDFESEILDLLLKGMQESRGSGSNFQHEIKALLEKRIQESLLKQFALYQRVNPSANTRAVIDQVFSQEEEKFLEFRNRWEDREDGDFLIRCMDMIHDWLPDLRQQFYNRYP